MMDVLSRLAQLDTCVVSDALDKLGLRGVAAGLSRLATDKKLAGQILTVKLEAANGRLAERHLCTAAIEAARAGEQLAQNQKLPLAADNPEGGFRGTVGGFSTARHTYVAVRPLPQSVYFTSSMTWLHCLSRRAQENPGHGQGSVKVSFTLLNWIHNARLSKNPPSPLLKRRE